MIQNLLDKLSKYFEEKPALNHEEKELLNELRAGYFPVATLHRNELEEKGFIGVEISDEQMEDLARKMEKDYHDRLFWDSMEIIAENMDLPRHPRCPSCGYGSVRLHGEQYRCDRCGEQWNGSLYVLACFPDDTSKLEERHIGYPCFTDEDNGARYVPEYEYIGDFKRTRRDHACFKAVRWPESQAYLPGGNLHTEDCRPILDELGIEDFGTNAVWIPFTKREITKEP